MHSKFVDMRDAKWFERAHFYTGSITDRDTGFDFRYRYEQIDKGENLKVSTYSQKCYEKADDVEECVFPYTDEGASQIREWYQAQYEKYVREFK